MKIRDVRKQRGPSNVIVEALIAKLEERRARNDSKYFIVTLQDKTGRLPVLVFDSGLVDMMPRAVGKAVEMLCEIGEYKGNTSIKAKEMTYIAVNPEEFVTTPAIATDVDRAHAFFREVSSRYESPVLKKLFDTFSTPEWVGKYSRAAAAKEVHHAYRGGFLEHIYTLMSVYLSIHDAKIYPLLNSDVVFLGLLLHDIGKLVELEEVSPGCYDYTIPGLSQGHLVMSYRMCYEEAVRLGIQNDTEVLQVLHVILAHHGTYEFGSPVMPATAEALMVHHLDNMDSKLHIAFHGTHLERQPYLGNVRLLRFGDDEA